MQRPPIPETPAGAHLRWWLDSIEDPESMTAEHVLARQVRVWQDSPWLKSSEEGRKRWKDNWERFGEFVIEEIQSVSPLEVSITLAPKQKEKHKTKVTFIVEEETPHRVRLERWDQVYDFDLQIKEATEEDAEVLSDIERRAAVVLGDTKIITDRGEDYFAAARLMDDVTVFLASIDGDPAGVGWGALAPQIFLGEEKQIVYFFHLRIAPEHQRKGLWGALSNAVWMKYWEKEDIYVGYYLLENVVWSHVAEQVRSRPDYVARDWVPTVYRVLLPTATLASASSVKRATREDAGRIVEILNDFHAGEEFYMPYTEESLMARLERDPSYSWNDVLLSEGAVLGLWPAGQKVEIVVEQNGQVTRNRRGHVMDYGFLPGHGEEFSNLLGACCSELDRAGLNEISIFTSKGARGQSVLRDLKGRVEPYRFNTGTSAMIPDEAQNTGIYTDHLYI